MVGSTPATLRAGHTGQDLVALPRQPRIGRSLRRPRAGRLGASDLHPGAHRRPLPRTRHPHPMVGRAQPAVRVPAALIPRGGDCRGTFLPRIEARRQHRSHARRRFPAPRACHALPPASRAAASLRFATALARPQPTPASSARRGRGLVMERRASVAPEATEPRPILTLLATCKTDPWKQQKTQFSNLRGQARIRSALRCQPTVGTDHGDEPASGSSATAPNRSSGELPGP